AWKNGLGLARCLSADRLTAVGSPLGDRVLPLLDPDRVEYAVSLATGTDRTADRVPVRGDSLEVLQVFQSQRTAQSHLDTAPLEACHQFSYLGRCHVVQQ